MLSILRFLFLILNIAIALFGQASAINGDISGTVTDPSGAPVPDAKVTAKNTRTGYEQTVATSTSGQYRVTVLPLGDYEVSVDASGFSPYRRTGIALSAGSVTMDVGLQVKGVATEVV